QQGDSVHAIAVEPRKRRVLSGGRSGVLSLRSLDAPPAAPAPGHRGSIFALVALPGGQVLTGGADGTIRTWDQDGREVAERLEAHRRSIFALALSPDGTRVASADEDGEVKLWTLADRRLAWSAVHEPTRPGESKGRPFSISGAA